MTTADLFPKLVPPRRKPRVLMHVWDAGPNPNSLDEDGGGIAIFECSKCKHQTDWLSFRTFTEAKRGIPCERCNLPSPPAAGEPK